MNTSVRMGGTLIALGVALCFVFAVPSVTSAQSVPAVQTRQVLPPGGNSCVALTASNVTPYISEGDLHSFDVTVNNASYVALLGTIGSSPVGFQYMTRDVMPSGQLRIHVDVPIELSNFGSVTLTLLSAQGNVTCISTVSFSIAGLDQGSGPGMPPPITGGGSGGSGTGSGTGAPSAPKPPKPPVAPVPPVPPVPPTATSGTSTGGGYTDSLSGACSAIGGMQLWLILIAIFVIIAVITAINEQVLSRRSAYLPAAAILVPLLILLGFWFLAAECRGTVWMPVILLVIAAGGLIAVYRNHKAIASIIELPPAKPPQK